MGRRQTWKKGLGLVGLAALLGSTAASASGVQILGFLGNFDVYNHTGSGMEGFEIELEGMSTGDLMVGYPTYCGSAFACGEGFNTARGLSVVYDGNASGARVSTLPDGAITHFGVHLTSLPKGPINYNWLDRNVSDSQLYIAGTNKLAGGQIAPPIPPAPPAPVPPPVVITPDWSLNGATLTAVLKNTTNHPIWVQGVSAEDVTAVSLDDLLATNPLFSSLPMAEAQLLDPGDSLTEAGDIAAATIGGRAMFWIYSYSGPERVTDTTSAGVEIFGQDCSVTACTFATMHGDLQSRMMTSVSVGAAPVPVPASLPLLLSALTGVGYLNRRRVRGTKQDAA